MKLNENERNALRVTVDYTNMTDKYLGKKGFSKKQLDGYEKAAKAAHAYVSENRGKDELFMGWTELPYNQDEIVADILKTATRQREFRKLRRARNRRFGARPDHGVQRALPSAL